VVVIVFPLANAIAIGLFAGEKQPVASSFLSFTDHSTASSRHGKRASQALICDISDDVLFIFLTALVSRS
jgi:hypothetical protein